MERETSSSVVEKIKRLLALSTDQSTTEAERANALQKAQLLMAKYSVDMSACQEKPEEIIKMPLEIKYAHPLPIYLHDFIRLSSLLQPISQNFGCWTLYNQAEHKLYLYGFKTNCIVAEQAIAALLNQGLMDFRVQFILRREMGFAISFWNGWAQGIKDRFTKLSDSQAIVLYDKVKDELEKFCQFETIHLMESDADGQELGKLSAQRSYIGTGLDGKERKGLK